MYNHVFCLLQRGRIACNVERCISHGNPARLSVCLSHAGTLSRRIKIGSRGLYCEVAKQSSFLLPTMVGSDAAFNLTFALKVALLLKAPTSNFDQYLLITSQSINDSLVVEREINAT